MAPPGHRTPRRGHRHQQLRPVRPARSPPHGPGQRRSQRPGQPQRAPLLVGQQHRPHLVGVRCPRRMHPRQPRGAPATAAPAAPRARPAQAPDDTPRTAPYAAGRTPHSRPAAPERPVSRHHPRMTPLSRRPRPAATPVDNHGHRGRAERRPCGATGDVGRCGRADLLGAGDGLRAAAAGSRAADQPYGTSGQAEPAARPGRPRHLAIGAGPALRHPRHGCTVTGHRPPAHAHRPAHGHPG